MNTFSESSAGGSESWQVGWDTHEDNEVHDELVGQLGEVQHDFEEAVGDNSANSFMPDPAGEILTMEHATNGIDEQFEEFVDGPTHSELAPFVKQPAEEILTEDTPHQPRETSMWERMTSRIDEIVDFGGRRGGGCKAPSRCPSPGDIMMVAVAVFAIALIIYLLMEKKSGSPKCPDI